MSSQSQRILFLVNFFFFSFSLQTSYFAVFASQLENMMEKRAHSISNEPMQACDVNKENV